MLRRALLLIFLTIAAARCAIRKEGDMAASTKASAGHAALKVDTDLSQRYVYVEYGFPLNPFDSNFSYIPVPDWGQSRSVVCARFGWTAKIRHGIEFKPNHFPVWREFSNGRFVGQDPTLVPDTALSIWECSLPIDRSQRTGFSFEKRRSVPIEEADVYISPVGSGSELFLQLGAMGTWLESVAESGPYAKLCCDFLNLTHPQFKNSRERVALPGNSLYVIKCKGGIAKLLKQYVNGDREVIAYCVFQNDSTRDLAGWEDMWLSRVALKNKFPGR